MSEVINGYELFAPLTNAGAGFAKWGHASKGGEEYFIKEFLDPCYPMKDSPFDESMKRMVLQGCQKYEDEKRLLYTRINEVSDGNLTRIREFFRWNGKYYITTQWIEPAGWPPSSGGVEESGSKLSIDDLYHVSTIEERIRCCLALSHALMCLHSAMIVHADIKPRNIMLTQTVSGAVSPRVIDMDSSFFVSDPPDELVCDQLYLAPESVLFMMQGRERSPVGCAADVFALGLVFHQVFAGKLPDLPSGYNFACEACLDGAAPKVSRAIPKHVKRLIADMVEREVSKRPPMAEVHRRLWGCLNGKNLDALDYAEKRVMISVPNVFPEAAVDAFNKGEGYERSSGAESRVRLNVGGINTGSGADNGRGANRDEDATGGVFYRPSGL